MAGEIRSYGADPNRAIATKGRKTRSQKPAFIGLSVGKVAAVKLYDPKARAEVTKLALVFNEHTDTPQVLLFPTNTVFESLRASLTAEVAEKVRDFPDFLASQPPRTVTADEVAEAIDSGEAEEL